MKNVIFFQAGHFFFFLPFRFMFCINISIWMGIYPIYTVAEAESRRYLGIYILTVCLSFATFKNNKISIPLKVKSAVHLFSGPGNGCVWGLLKRNLAGDWWVASISSQPPGCMFSMISARKPCISLPYLRKTILKKVTIHSSYTFSLLASVETASKHAN